MTDKTILIVDDQPDNVYLLEKQLEGHGFKTITAKHGIEGLKLLDENKIDMIISDIVMPEMAFCFVAPVKNIGFLKKYHFYFIQHPTWIMKMKNLDWPWELQNIL